MAKNRGHSLVPGRCITVVSIVAVEPHHKYIYIYNSFILMEIVLSSWKSKDFEPSD